MRFRKTIITSLFLTVAFAVVAVATPPYKGNTKSGDQWAILNTLTDIYTSLSNIYTTLGNIYTATLTPANLAAANTGGCTPAATVAATASTNSTSVVGTVATLCMIDVTNTTATAYYLRLYDSSSAPTCSSATNWKQSYLIPASTSGAGNNPNLGTFGLAFANGIGYCVTGGAGSTDNTNAASGVLINLGYKS